MKKILHFLIVLSFILVISGCNKKDSTTSMEKVDETVLQTTYLEKPVSGRVKAQSPIDNIFIALNILKNANYYESESSGEVVAKKKIKLTTQKVNSRRIITPTETFNESISVSSFVKVAEQLYITDQTILKRDASKVSQSSVKWNDNTTSMSQQQYENTYGYSFKNPTRYIINENSIISDIEIVNNGKGRKYTYKFELDPTIAPYLYKKSVQNLSGSSSVPNFTKIEMIMTFDYKWRMTKIETNETYEITIPVLGNVICEASLIENFKNIDKVINYNEKSFFENQLKSR